MRLHLALLPFLAAVSYAQHYLLQSSFSGLNFFENFNFWTASDPTFGYVHYVDQPTAEQYGMIKTTNETATWGVDTSMYLDGMANLGRLSVRLTSLQSWTHGLFILDLAHMPANQCGVWPAWWMLGSGIWPENGEIDIIESTNNLPNNLMALHTSESPNCTVAGADQSGTLLTADCARGGGFTGCGVSATKPNNIGHDFNSASGGVYAMEWTSTAIRIWFFTRNEVPASIAAAGNSGPDPATFGEPVANFQGSCDIDAHFFNHSMVFDTTFCGSYAGNTWQGDGCPLTDPTNGWQSCNDFVAANPQAFVDAYWEVNYLKVYQTTAAAQVTSSSSLSSVTPAIKTSSVSSALSGAQGRSTTPSGTPSLVITTPTFTPASVISSLLGSSSAAQSTLGSASRPSSVTKTSIAMPLGSAGASSTATSASSVALSSSSPTVIYATTVVVVVTVEPEGPATLAPQIGGRQVVEGSTTYWPEPFPSAYCEANPSACDGAATNVRADYSDHRHGMPLFAPEPVEGSVSPRGLDAQSSSTSGLPPIMAMLGPDGVDLVPANGLSASLESDLAPDNTVSGEGLKVTMPGGSIGYCGVVGEACLGHRKQEVDVTQHIDAPQTMRSESPLMTPRPALPLMTTRPMVTVTDQPPPAVPYVGPNGIVFLPPKNPVHKPSPPEERDAQGMKGGSIGYCGVVGEACNGHRRRTEDTTAAPLTTAPALTTLVTQVRVPQMETPMLYLEEPALETTYWIDGTEIVPPPYTPTFFSYDPQSKRMAEAFTTEMKPPIVPASDLYLDGVVMMTTYWIDGSMIVPPPYTVTFFSYDPQSKRTVAAIEPTPLPNESATTTAVQEGACAGTDVAHIAEKNLWAREPSTAKDQPLLPTTVFHAPSGPKHVLQRSAPAVLYPQEGTAQPIDTSTHHDHISSATCLPVVVVDESGVPAGTGCLAPQGVSMTRSEPILVAETTSTATLSIRTTGTASKYNELVDAIPDGMAGAAAQRLLTATVGFGAMIAVFVTIMALL